MIKTSSLLNINIHSIDKDILLNMNPKGVMITPNVDHLMKLQRDKHFYNIYNSADYILCDSKIIYWISKFLGDPIKEQIAGSDFFPAYCDYYSKKTETLKKRIFLLGGTTEEHLKSAIKNIRKRTKSEIVIGGYCPPFGFEKDIEELNKIINIINASGANVLAVGVGAPKQEKFIFENKEKLKSIDLFMAIGATIDFESGKTKRAPRSFQKIGLEWAYRLFQEPKRMFRRYLIEDIPFFYLVVKQKLGLYKNPFITDKK